jgi:hypothetical protein
MKIITLISTLLLINCAMAQTVKEANVYPSNLEENMYYTNFNQGTNTIEGLYFMILSDGENSKFVTPAFEVTLYLLPEGSTSKDDLIVVRTIKLDGIYHFGSHEYKNEKVNLNETAGIKPGRYRFGIWVNSTESFSENTNDNATLFGGVIEVKKETKGEAAEKKSDDGWGDLKKEEKKKTDDDDSDDSDW